MTNQTIDGVPGLRDLLVRIRHGCAFTLSTKQHDELRALLDAPAKLPPVNVHDGRLIAALRKRVAELEAAQPQGDERLMPRKPTAAMVAATSLSTTLGTMMCQAIYASLPAEQPAPVAVVPDA